MPQYAVKAGMPETERYYSPHRKFAALLVEWAADESAVAEAATPAGEVLIVTSVAGHF